MVAGRDRRGAGAAPRADSTSATADQRAEGGVGNPPGEGQSGGVVFGWVAAPRPIDGAGAERVRGMGGSFGAR
jgi:hypothetical protein